MWRLRNDDGFSLIELMVIILILGVLAAIAVPTFLRQRDRSYAAAVVSDVRAAAIFMELGRVESGTGAYSADAIAHFPLTDGVLLDVGWVTEEAYCLDGSHESSSSAARSYDSQSGGLQPVGYACASTPGEPPVEVVLEDGAGGPGFVPPGHGGTPPGQEKKD